MNSRLQTVLAGVIVLVIAGIVLWQIHPLATLALIVIAGAVGVFWLRQQSSSPEMSAEERRRRSIMPAPGYGPMAPPTAYTPPPSAAVEEEDRAVDRVPLPQPVPSSTPPPAEREQWQNAAPPPPPPSAPAPAPAIPIPAAPAKPITPPRQETGTHPVVTPEPAPADDKKSALEEQASGSSSQPDDIDLDEVGVDDEAAEEEEAAAETAPPPIFFSAYYARESAAEQTQGLYVYAHLQDALAQISSDVQQFVENLGGIVPRSVAAQQSAALAVGTLLTIMPEAEGLEFDPAAVTRKWQPPYTRFDFSYRAPQHLVGEIVTGRIAVLVAGIEIAHIKFATMIEAAVPATADPVSLPANPLAAAKLSRTEPTPPYKRIFVSYSRKDKIVADNYRLAQIAAGNEVFMDTYSIRAGEDWRAALALAIDSADIFQLFWSEHSAGSGNVRDEWDYALHFRCPQDLCADFILPVFWEDPMPAPPQELSHLNFRRVPFREPDETSDAEG